MVNEVGIGVVGTGGWASDVHLPAYQNHPRARLVGVYDPDGESAERAAKRFGAETVFPDYESMLSRDDIDAIDIITPNVTHARLALAAIAAGKHVLCEKPIAMNVDEAQQMADAARAANLKTAVNFTWRNPPAALYVRHLIQQGKVGRIYHVYGSYRAGWGRDPQRPFMWRLQKEAAGTGVLGDIGSHIIDMVEWMTSERITSLVADLNTFTPERPLVDGEMDAVGGMATVDVDDAASFLARLSGGGMATFLATFYGTGERMNQGVEIFGQKGSLKMEYNNQETIRAALDPASGDYQFVDIPIPERFKNMSLKNENLKNEDLKNGGHDLRQNTVRKFIDAIANDEEMTPSFEDGLRNQKVIDTVVASALKGTWVDVPE